MEVIFSNRAYLAIITETSEKVKVETGGVFLGCYENGFWYVVETLDPGPKSIFRPTYFEYDRAYTEHLINKVARLYHSKLTLIGLWHRHPGSFDQFSSTDDGTNSEYARLSPNGAVSVLVNIDPKFRITPYHVGSPLKYSRIRYKVGDDLIPEHIMRLKSPDVALEYVNNYSNRAYRDRGSRATSVDFVRLLEGIRHKFEPVPYEVTKEDLFPNNGKHKDFLIDSLLEDIDHLSNDRGLSLNIEHSDPFLCLSHKGADGTIAKVYFVYIASRRQITFSYDEDRFLYEAGLIRGLLMDFVPSDTAFKKGFMRMLGLGKNSQE